MLQASRAATTYIAIVGQTDARQVACLLHTALEGTANARPVLLCPDAAFPSIRLEQACAEGATHIILVADCATLSLPVFARLQFSVAAPVGPAANWAGLDRILSHTDMTVSDLDEIGQKDYVSIGSGCAFTYSENKAFADLTARNLRLFPGHTEFEAVATGQIHRIHLPVCGGFAVYHALCALSCGLCLGLELGQMARLLRVARGPAGCMEVLPIPAAYTVLLDRAGDLPSLERVLTTARSFTARRLVCLLDSRGGPKMAELAGHLADRVLPFGSTRADRQQAIVRGLDRARPGDVLVLTGTDGGAPEREFIRACAHSCALRRKGNP